MEYLVVAFICFILGCIYNSGEKDKLDKQIMSNLKLGKRVILCIDNDATLFERHGDKIRITKAIVDFNPEPIDLPIGEQDELNADVVDISRSSKSDNYNETGMGD